MSTLSRQTASRIPSRLPGKLASRAILLLLLCPPIARAEADDTNPGACVEISAQPESDSFQFLPSNAHTELAQSIPATAVIGTIRLQRFNVFDPDDPAEDNWIYGLANDWHSLTRESVLRDHLLIEEGDPYDPARVEETERILRALKFIYDTAIRPWRLCGNVVDVEVVTRDVWTLIPTVSFSRSGGEDSYTLGFRDTNFLGSGKQIAVFVDSDDERTGTTVAYKDPALLGSRWQFRFALTDNDDGFDRSLLLHRPFFSVYETWSAGIGLQEQELEQKIWFRGDEVAEFDHAKEEYRLFGGTALDVREDHRVQRLLFGYHYQSNEFDFSDSNIPPPSLPEARDYSYPFVGIQSIEDNYTEVKNINFLGRTEDLYVGEQYLATLGWSDESLGASRDQLAINASYGNTLLVNPDQLWTAQTAITGFWNVDSEDFENLWWNAQTRYHHRQADKWAWFGALNLVYTDGLTADNQLTLGGSNGLRGYDRNYQTGDRAFVVNLEQRYYSDWHPFRLLRVGAAAFIDVGRAWFNNRDNGPNGEVLANAGIGLRLNSSRAQKSSVIHIDLAFPFVGDDDVDDYQFLVTIKNRF